MEMIEVFRDLAIILVVAKFFGVVARKLRAPQVVGEIIAGLIIGPSVFGLVEQSEFLVILAEIGVILLMFSAGLETDLKELLKTGPKAFLIACFGVLIPLVGGALLYFGFYGMAPWGSEAFYKAVFIGTILTATSVSITVSSLKEMGYLKGKIGTTIVSAAIIDDIIGIVVLTVVLGSKNPENSIGKVLISTGLFFGLAILIGFIAYKAFVYLDNRYPRTRRIPIFGLALALSMSYVAEKYFGIADITGAYIAGVILCSIRDSDYIAEKMDINSYMLFGPVFFASIGLKTNIDNLTMSIIVFTIGIVIVGIATKIIGCGIMAKFCGFKNNEAIKIGIGMMSRGEVALIVAQKGLTVGLISPIYFTSIIILIIITSVLSPILLKYMYTKYPEDKLAIS